MYITNYEEKKSQSQVQFTIENFTLETDRAQLSVCYKKVVLVVGVDIGMGGSDYILPQTRREIGLAVTQAGALGNESVQCQFAPGQGDRPETTRGPGRAPLQH